MTRVFLASPLGFLIGLSLGALGGGGSILAVPVLVHAAGQDARAATATSLLLVGAAALVGMLTHWRAGRVRVATGLVFGAVGTGGSLIGSALNSRLDPDVLLLAFAALVGVAAWRMLTGCPTCTRVGEQHALEKSGATDGATGPGGVGLVTATARRTAVVVDVRLALTVLAAGTAVGLLTGLFGVGGGFVVVPALALLLKLPMPEAIGTSLLVIAINAAVALASRLGTASIEWRVAAPFTVAAIGGVLSGGAIADRLDAPRSLRWFAGLLIAVALYTAGRAAGGLGDAA